MDEKKRMFQLIDAKNKAQKAMDALSSYVHEFLQFEIDSLDNSEYIGMTYALDKLDCRIHEYNEEIENIRSMNSRATLREWNREYREVVKSREWTGMGIGQ